MDGLREVALQASPKGVRPALRALWDIDLAFAQVVATTTTPPLGAIRLAWWRERLDELDEGADPPAEPRLRTIASLLIPAGIRGADISRLEDCWLPLLAPYPWGDAEADAVAQRGATLFSLAARVLGGESAGAEPYGALWSLADAAMGVSDSSSRELLRERARAAMADLPRRSPPKLASLTMIAMRRAYDLFHGHRGRWHRLLFALRASLREALS